VTHRVELITLCPQRCRLLRRSQRANLFRTSDRIRVAIAEGDALFHSRQVFSRAKELMPYDEDFFSAALLHDVGKAIDPHDHQAPMRSARFGKWDTKVPCPPE
jgi:hypothetical protein